jgi:hypothetical protein
MSNEIPVPQNYIPDLPRDMSVGKDGNLSFDLQSGLSNLFQTLQTLVTNQGIRPPALTMVQQTNIATFYTSFVGKKLPQNVPNIAGTIASDASSSGPIVFIMTFDPTTLFVLATPSWRTITHS